MTDTIDDEMIREMWELVRRGMLKIEFDPRHPDDVCCAKVVPTEKAEAMFRRAGQTDGGVSAQTDVYHGDVYWTAVTLIANFARDRAKVGDVTEARLVEIFAENVMKELLQDGDG